MTMTLTCRDCALPHPGSGVRCGNCGCLEPTVVGMAGVVQESVPATPTPPAIRRGRRPKAVSADAER